MRLMTGPVLAAALLALAACSRPAPEPQVPADFEVAVGVGGGFTGATRTVRLRPDGSLVVEFRTAGRLDAEVPAGRIDDASRREAWRLLHGPAFATLGCEPGNMTESIEIREGGVTHRACAPMDQGSPEWRRVLGEIERLVAAPARGVQPPPPPLPPMPFVLRLEVVNADGIFRVAREASPLPAGLEVDTRRLGDAAMQPIWEAVFASRFYSGAGIEERDGVPLPGAPYACPDDVSVRVTSGTADTWETRQRCVEGDAPAASLAAAVVGAARAAAPP